MTDQPQPSIGTVAEEAARLISAVAAMAHSTTDTTYDPSPYAGMPPQEPASPGSQRAERPEDTVRPDDEPPQRAASAGPGPSSASTCSACGGGTDSTPAACRLCPWCQGIALLRAVRPETVDRLADLAYALTTTLRDMATQSRASGPGSGPGRPSEGPTVQDIPVDDGDKG